MRVNASFKLMLAAAVSAVAFCVIADAGPRLKIAPSKLRSVTPSDAKPVGELTGSIPRTSRIAPIDGSLKTGLDALSNKDARNALAVRNGMEAGTLDRHILTWAIAVSGQRGVPFAEIARAERDLKGWPGLAALRGHFERALYREDPDAGTVLAAFGKAAPETPEGSIILTRALLAGGKTAEAAAVIRTLWTGETLDVATEDRILAEFSGLLRPADQKRRLELLLYRSRTTQAERFATLAKAQSLYKAFVAVIKQRPKADAAIKAVDASWASDPAFLFLRIENLRRQDKYEEAAALLKTMPNDAAALVDAGQWWTEQRIISRGLADAGDFKAAYAIAANHAATEATDVVEAEFHAGWYALRGLKNPALAEQHFKRILDASARPLSASRAWYWLGRTAEDGGPGDAKALYARAAAFPATFYGQLASARLGRKTLNVTYPSPAVKDRQAFEGREAVRAITRLEESGHGWRADSLYRGLAEQLETPGELALLADRAEKTRGHQLSLQIGKIAFGRGIDVAALAFPIGVIPQSANISGSGTALAYAIARQESAFNPAAVSPANARGLLQILPGTAKGVAGRFGMAYSQEKLTTDAAYNATLGAHYLGEQISDFGGSYILTFVAYNAGPRRVPQWIARYGDPRGMALDDVVDWIERIPFGETRGYVQRVMENYQVYKSRLGQTADIEQDLRAGR
ncbi:lytic transglycosylase domain-containing protein [Pararhizobium sp.]|uniref:lytic transglycosylase domain-containing protein n=1 Tax=Pararhizobium sp. TaxID=1977563 RepID=UPI002725C9A2|nr:lytic transglycosylase domain-containing protein [Pararhizobium sp.]MDO9417480.1 lytic transglycosylase domain-containing protein [Pararhizobium sp.]